MTRWPNLFVVGAPKCGTTAVWRYLEPHPKVYMSPRKDLHYFGRDLGFRAPRVGRESYLEHFADAGDAEVVGDVSVWMLFSRAAAGEIAGQVPGARAVICLRNPLEAMPALHAQFLLNGLGQDQDLADFGEAIDAIEDRRAGRRLPPRCSLPEALDYVAVYRYVPQIQRFRQALGAENVHCVLLDDWKRDAERTYRDLLDFLGLEPAGIPSLEPVNRRKTTRSETVRKLVRLVPSGLKDALPRALRRPLSRTIRRLNSSHVSRQAMDSGLRQRLLAEVAPDVHALEGMLQRDLSDWLDPHSRA